MRVGVVWVIVVLLGLLVLLAPGLLWRLALVNPFTTINICVNIAFTVTVCFIVLSVLATTRTQRVNLLAGTVVILAICAIAICLRNGLAAHV